MNTNSPLGVAVIGHAFMGRAHSHAWRNVGAFFDVEPPVRRVLVGRDSGRVDAAASRYGWDEASTDWRSVIERDDIDIVDVCAPGTTHSTIAIAALAAGKHVIVEKPMATTLADAVHMHEASIAASVHGQHAIVNFNYRRVPALALARQLIVAERIGTIRHIRAAYLQDWLSDPNAPMSWRLRKEEAGSGVLGDLGSHLVDLVTYLTGEHITGLSGAMRTFVESRPMGESGDGSIGGTISRGENQRRDAVTVDDAMWATGELSGGGVLSLEASRVALGRKNELTLQVFGDRASLMFNLENLNELWLFDSQDPTGQQGYRRILATEAGHPYAGNWWPDGHIIGWEHTFTHQFAEFLTGIEEGVPRGPSFSDGLSVQRTLRAVEDSAADGGRFIHIEKKEKKS